MDKKAQGKASLKFLHLHVTDTLFQLLELENSFGLHWAILTKTKFCMYLW